ncbi:MAG: 50S ribosomal protein L32 [Bacteroidetes bacterium]|nr:50S ribosomal protein L32 [Bacteroidota bacterium]
MAHPKRRHSTTRRDKRRTTYKAVAPTLSTCSNCNQPVLYHRVCGACGYYKGKQAVEQAVTA